jgi:hypothetical protein
MKAKRGAKRSNTTMVAIALGMMGVVAILMLGVFAGLAEFHKILEDDSWNKESAENFLRTPLPTDVHDVKFGGRTGRGGQLDLSFEASYESVDTFVSQFCKGLLYQGYDPFNAIDTEKQHEGAYLITMEQYYPTSYYSYSPNTSDKLFGIRCVALLGFGQGNGPAQIQILVDKTSHDAALVKIEALFTVCGKCNAP